MYVVVWQWPAVRAGETSLASVPAARYLSGVAQIGRLLLIVAGLLACVGGLLLLGDKVGLGRVPGDLVWRRKGVTVYFPLVTSLALSVILTLLMNLFLRRK